MRRFRGKRAVLPCRRARPVVPHRDPGAVVSELLVPGRQVLIRLLARHVKAHDAGVRHVIIGRVHRVEALLPGRVPKVDLPASGRAVSGRAPGLGGGGVPGRWRCWQWQGQPEAGYGRGWAAGARAARLVLCAVYDPDVPEERQGKRGQLRQVAERGVREPAQHMRAGRPTAGAAHGRGCLTCRGWYSFIRKRSTSFDLPTAESPSKMILMMFS
eukprot:scaffold2672_cov112-Isochrysis_galbana.AAC.5